MDSRSAALALARGRIAVGIIALLAPGLAARAMFGRRGDRPGTRLFARMLGGRDLALGLGVVIALDRGAPVRGWLEAGALADGVDLAGTLLAREDLPASTVSATAAMAGGAAAAGLLLSRQLDPAPRAEPGQPEAIVTGHPA
jgi:peptide-methionine (R)-S-oxide reductase